VSNVTEHGGTLTAQIDPNGLETEYAIWLQYPNCQSAAPDGSGCPSVSEEVVARGSIPAGVTGQAVSANLSGLQSDHPYSYWVLASNPAGKTEGPHQIFGTPAGSAPEPPSPVTQPPAAPGPPPASTPPAKTTAKMLSRAQTLAKAVKKCRGTYRKNQRKRTACEKAARARYGQRDQKAVRRK
jgi:hypothetical protein